MTYCPLPGVQRWQNITWSVTQMASPGICLVVKGEPHFLCPHHPNMKVEAL